jgi:hypothetical protein
MNPPMPFTKRAVLTPAVAVVAFVVLVACDDDVPRNEVRVQAAPETRTTVYFGTEYGPVETRLSSEPSPPPQAF